MGETANIAEIANKVANELFARFLWRAYGPRDESWPCEQPSLHGKRARAKKSSLAEPESEGDRQEQGKASPKHESGPPIVTHPTDLVFAYDEPYSEHRTYINCDLKSYAASSITKGQVRKAVTGLAETLTCMERSITWRTRYVANDKNALYAGMLFVYNHDGEYDGAFNDILSDTNFSGVDIPRNSKIVVLGPREISWLDNVSDQIARMRGDKLIGPPEQTRFFYPPLVFAKNVQPSARAATIEMLTGPWIVMKHRMDGLQKEDVVVFYRGKGEQIEEFSLLVDYLMFHGLVDEGVSIVVCSLMPDKEASARFEKAIDDYIIRYEGGSEIATLLRSIRFQSMTYVRRQFSTSEIGMDRGK